MQVDCDNHSLLRASGQSSCSPRSRADMVGLNGLLHNSEAATPKSSRHALELLALAREADDDAAANFFLGWLSENGDGDSVPLSRERASEYFRLAIDASAGINAPALLHLSGQLSDDRRESEAVALLEQAVKGSADLSCMCCLAKTLSWGAAGVPKDAARAKRLYERVIEAGRDGSTIKADAIWALACLVQRGARGIGQADVETATSLFGQLVDGWNNVQAVVRLGDMAASKRNFDRAYGLYRKASEGRVRLGPRHKGPVGSIF
jgi:TPR repeat protein